MPKLFLLNSKEIAEDLLVSQFHNNKKVIETPIGIGEINGSTGIRVDVAIDNKENCSLFLYFLSGQIMTCALKKSSESRIRILSLINDNENATIGKEVQNCLLFEDTDERKKQKQLEQMVQLELMMMLIIELQWLDLLNQIHLRKNLKIQNCLSALHNIII